MKIYNNNEYRAPSQDVTHILAKNINLRIIFFSVQLIPARSERLATESHHYNPQTQYPIYHSVPALSYDTQQPQGVRQSVYQTQPAQQPAVNPPVQNTNWYSCPPSLYSALVYPDQNQPYFHPVQPCPPQNEYCAQQPPPCTKQPHTRPGYDSQPCPQPNQPPPACPCKEVKTEDAQSALNATELLIMLIDGYIQQCGGNYSSIPSILCIRLSWYAGKKHQFSYNHDQGVTHCYDKLRPAIRTRKYPAEVKVRGLLNVS